MRSLSRAFGFGATVLWLGAMPVTGQAPPQQVITDTPEYCLHLRQRMSELLRLTSTPPPPEVTVLSSEGQRMCDHGQTRGGILRLRRALMMMMHKGE